MCVYVYTVILYTKVGVQYNSFYIVPDLSLLLYNK